MAVSGSTRPLDNLPGPQQDGWPSLGWPSVQKDMVYRLLEPKVVDLVIYEMPVTPFAQRSDNAQRREDVTRSSPDATPCRH